VTEEELDYLIERQTHAKLWRGRRADLNAMTSAQFVDSLERKLQQYGGREDGTR
jgi:hypothetical protein